MTENGKEKLDIPQKNGHAAEPVCAAVDHAELSVHEALAVVLQIRAGELSVLLWRRALPPCEGAWALPGGRLGPKEDLGGSIRRQLAQKVDVRDLSHLEQLETRSDPDRVPRRRTLATAYLGLVPADVDPAVPEDTDWHPASRLPTMAFDHASIVRSGRRRLRAKLSYTNVGFALAPPEFTMSQLSGYYRAALGHDVTATNLRRVLLRRGQIEETGRSVPSGRSGGRPAALFRFRERGLQITDAFAVLRPPG
ncbi:NUDIX domain-containing protein [Nocardiopsis sp. ATB16-24]|uniref:NUDIX hydrolase n=1 Tax=Nocardiopsis sp. ATB16-24 TaxID=3019555 RepID=UPI0025558DD9|nr:NUDIX domain-containing protein [Nocardiopsis sp. ATB16-24]